MAPPPVYRKPLDGTEMIRVLKDGRYYMAPVTAVLDLLGLPAVIAPILSRLSALEGRPEEVAHFTASAKLPAITLLAPVTLTLTGLVPARVGDVLKAGEQVEVAPATPLPANVNIAAAIVTADGTVVVQLTAGVSISAGAAPITWNISALR
ncbi:hypothetical protein [Methylobacterium sp. D54C]